jgi:hypothetical protein
LAYPSTKAEQEAISAILSDMDAEIAMLEAKLTKVREIKQGMMHNLLTGKIRLLWNIGQPERATQSRIIALFRDELGYSYLGDWTDRDGNSNIEEGLVTDYLTKIGYTQGQISSALLQIAHRGRQSQP